ncbi:MAG: hypothetical protein E7557_05880 [Ruminococcaceae bacterium]|nr:hypothetical protein [Oscillospiraceae bacterium]
MNIEINKKLVQLYYEEKMNINYSLDFVLSSLDKTKCQKGFNIPIYFDVEDDKIKVEIDEANINTIRKIFGEPDNILIEKLLWIAFLFPEI